MPVKLDVSNSIISAYALGKQEATTAEELKKKQEQTQVENEQKQAQIDAQKQQFEESLANDKANQLATHKLQQAQLDLQQQSARQQLIQGAEQTGNVPSGYNITSQDQYEMSPNVFGTRITATNPATGETIQFRAPRSAAQETGTLKATEAKPALEQNIDYEKQLKLFESNLQEETAKSLAQGKDSAEVRQLNIKNAHDKTMEQLKYEHDLNLANIKGNFELQKEGAKAANLPETWGLLTLDPDTRAKLKLPPGATWNDAFPGAKMPAKAQDEFKQYSTVEDLATTVKDALEKTYSDGQTGYQKYFLGAGFGSIADRLQNIAGQADPVVENIRPDIGKIFVAMKENAKVGSVVSPQEEKWVKSYAGGIERSLTPDRAKAIFDKLIPTVRQARLETVLSNSKSNRKEAVPETRTTQPTTDENTLPGGFRIGQ